jgi:beta-glucanase (GH16 family)
MKKRFILIVLAELFMFSAFSQHPTSDENWQVVFEDNFDTFNNSLWRKPHNSLHGKEPQVYINSNVYIENGKLTLRTKKQTYSLPNGNTYQYTSGEIVSNIPYQYGYYEIYAKLPASSGYWPAFWFWNNSPNTQTSNCWYNEIDVFEAYGNKPNAVESRVHWGFKCPANIYGSSEIGYHDCNYSTSYHWYGVEWTENKITWYVDRQVVRQEINNRGGVGLQNPMYIILNVALGNLVNSNTIFPNYMYIDQANAYKLKCDKNTVVNEISNFNTFNYAVKKSITLSGVTKIPPNSKISLKATNFIELKNGFEVPLGAELYLDITACE